MMHIKQQDPEVFEFMLAELKRQSENLELIASENFVSRAVLEAAGSVLTNKYAEGYPYRWSKKTGKINYDLYGRYYGGCEYIDKVEELAIERAKELFGADHANVQPHSGSQANMAAYFALIKPGDTILSLELSHGGHLTHGHPLSFSGSLYNIVPYGVNRDTEVFDYDEIRKIALEVKPQLILTGASAYPRAIDFEAFRKIADEVGAKFMVDMAHIAGLVAAGLHTSPVPYADVVTTTTHKTLRGPRAGPDPLQGRIRQGDRPVGIPRLPGRTSHAHHRRQGRSLQGSPARRFQDLPEADRRKRPGSDGRTAQARIPPRLRRHRHPPDADRPRNGRIGRTIRQENGRLPRPRRYHR